MFNWVDIGLLKYWYFQSKAKVEQIIAIVTTRKRFLFILYSDNVVFIFIFSLTHFFFNQEV